MSIDEEKKKREIFEGMSPRRQQKIMKKGYENWNPFLAPKEPPFFRKGGKSKTQTAAEYLQEFFLYIKGKGAGEDFLSQSYLQGVKEICSGLVMEEDERYQGMYDFCQWFRGKREEKEESG